MTGDELLTFARRDWLRDLSLPQLWSDDLIYLYLNEAQDKFCRQTYSLYSDAYTVDLVAGTAEYALDTTMLFVFKAWIDGRTTMLRNKTWRGTIGADLTTGEPIEFTFDERGRTLRVYPVPDQTYTLNLGAAVLPTDVIDATTEPELEAQYHIDLIEWVAYRCLRANDVDGQKVDVADKFRAAWDERVRDTKREVFRLRMGFDPTAMRRWTAKRAR